VDRIKHRVPPPAGNVTLVCCESTKGVLNIAVHPTWAPIGASNFLNMVNTHYFESRVPMMRAIKGFLIQFGLSSLPETQKEYESTYLRGKGGLKDDPQWLPEGPPGRQAEDGTRRFKKGYFACVFYCSMIFLPSFLSSFFPLFLLFLMSLSLSLIHLVLPACDMTSNHHFHLYSNYHQSTQYSTLLIITLQVRGCGQEQQRHSADRGSPRLPVPRGRLAMGGPVGASVRRGVLSRAG
jgi:hypothetical protein